MSTSLKIGLVLGALVLALGLGYWLMVKNGAQIDIFPLAQSPASSGATGSQDNSVDEFLASLESDSSLETGLSQEESTNLDQSMSSESQAISDFGQSYDANEL